MFLGVTTRIDPCFVIFATFLPVAGKNQDPGGSWGSGGIPGGRPRTGRDLGPGGRPRSTWGSTLAGPSGLDPDCPCQDLPKLAGKFGAWVVLNLGGDFGLWKGKILPVPDWVYWGIPGMWPHTSVALGICAR